MNKSAFTLIEMLAVIIVLGLILAIVVPSVTDSIKESKEKAFDTTVETVKSAAKSQMDFSFDTYKSQFISPGYITFTVAELIDSGFLSKDIKDPRTGNALGGSVRITKISENNYEYQYIN